MPTVDVSPLELKVGRDGFTMSSPEVKSAQEAHWYARTEWGIAVLRYADSVALLKDSRLSQGSAKWPAQHGVSRGKFYDWWSKTLLILEGEEHHRIRRLVNPAFAARRIAPMHQEFRSIADELIDGWIGQYETDFAEQFASPYATRILCRLLGIDEKFWQFIHDRASIIGLGLGVSIAENIDRIDAAIGDLTIFANQLISERRSSPGPDLLTVLVNTHDDDSDVLNDRELVNLIILLIFAGIDTTRNQLGLAIDAFCRQPDQWELLASDPAKYASKAVEEALRVNPIGRWISREAVDTFGYRDLTIVKGTTLHLFTKTSATDATAFDRPEEIDLRVDRQPHFAFGGGVHHCLGHFVARADIAEALSALSTRIKDLSVKKEAIWLPDSGNTGAVSLPITFSIR